MVFLTLDTIIFFYLHLR